MRSRLERNKKNRNQITKVVVEEKTKNITIKVFKISLALFIILSIIFVVFRYVATSGLVVREYGIDYDIPDNFYGLKIIQISDLNYNSETVDLDKVKQLVSKTNKLKPDLVLYTGDLIYKDIDNKDNDNLSKELSKINSTLGKYYVSGEEDNDETKIILTNAGFENLDNNYELIYKDNNSPILLTGIGNDNDYDKAFEYIKNGDKEIFTITMIHNPKDIEEIINQYQIDLLLAGHTFNGLIKIPKIGGVFNFECKYYDDYYKVDNTDVYISNGIGTKEYPYRLFNHPSINFFRLR